MQRGERLRQRGDAPSALESVADARDARLLRGRGGLPDAGAADGREAVRRAFHGDMTAATSDKHPVPPSPKKTTKSMMFFATPLTPNHFKIAISMKILKSSEELC